MHTGGCVVPSRNFVPQVDTSGERIAVFVKDSEEALYVVATYYHDGLPYRTEIAEGRRGVFRAMRDNLAVTMEAGSYDLDKMKAPIANFLRYVAADAYSASPTDVDAPIPAEHADAAALLDFLPSVTLGEMVVEFLALRAEVQPYTERYSVSEITARWSS